MIIFDEIQYAESIIRNGCSRKYILVDFKILAKYFLLHKQYSEERTREEMLLILKDGQTLIPTNYLPQKIELSMKFAKTEELRCSSPVAITYTELETINNFPEHLRELAFVYLFMSKWDNEKDGFFIEKSDLKRMLKSTSATNSKLNVLDGELERLKYIQFIDYCRKERIKVNNEDDGSDVAFLIEDFENVVLYYRRYCGKKVIECMDCGALIEIKSNSQKYCKCCARRNKVEQNKISRKKCKRGK